ncbi:DUF4446 family protein [Patescibacteria group bacterium]
MFDFITTDILVYIIIAITAIMILLLAWNIRLEIRLRRMLLGKNAKTLEDTINTFSNEIESLHKSREEVQNYLKSAEKRIKRSMQGIATVRFNPFKGTGSGGNQSFATAFIDENGNGVVISSLYSRDRMSVYAKPIEKYESEFELTAEEKEAIKKARLS